MPSANSDVPAPAEEWGWGVTGGFPAENPSLSELK
jgi:hypothetical protein